jgi:micrococcal nuclease
MNYEYKAVVNRVVDGDTVWMDVDLGFMITVRLDFRLAGINAPEVIGASKACGLKSKAELERLLSLGRIRAITSKSDKYGRWLAQLYVDCQDGSVIDVNATMVVGGFAVLYNP